MSKANILCISGINEHNIARRKSAGRTLTPDESERVAHFVRVLDAAVDYFGNKDEAASSLMKTTP